MLAGPRLATLAAACRSAPRVLPGDQRCSIIVTSIDNQVIYNINRLIKTIESGDQPWEKENAAEYFEASARRYTWVNDDNESGIQRLSASEAKAKAQELGLSVNEDYFANSVTVE